MSRRETKLTGIERSSIMCVDLRIISESVLYYFGLSAEDVRSRNRKLELIIPRHMIHYFASITQRPYWEISMITHRSHAQVISSCKTVENWIDTNNCFRQQALDIAQLIITNNAKQQLQND